MVKCTFPSPDVQWDPKPTRHVDHELLVRIGVLSTKGVIEVRRLHAEGRLEGLRSLLQGQEERHRIAAAADKHEYLG